MEQAHPSRRWSSRRRLVAAGGAAVALVLVGTFGALAALGPGASRAHALLPAPSPTSTVPPSASTTTAPAVAATTTTWAVPGHPPGLGMGDSGAAVQALQQRLTDLKYDPGTIDGHFGTETWQAVVAFQKVSGMSRTGWAGPDVLRALSTASPPAPLMPAGGPNRVEIDIPRQVLMLYEGGQLVRTMMISTGGGYRYCVDGQCDIAVTPGGSYRIFEKVLGLVTSKLGQLYNPLYFNGGIAIHGEPAVPVYPASHGCVRIPMSESMWFYDRVPYGEAVYVVGGSEAPVPFNAPAPNGQAPVTNPAPATTTTAPPKPTTTTTAPPRPTTTTVPPSTTSTTRPSTTTTTA